MPVYEYECKTCKYKTTVFRTIKDYDLLPVIEGGEVKEPCTTEDKKHDWEKKLGSFTVQRGKNWSGSKGNWLVLFAIVGASFFGSCEKKTPYEEFQNHANLCVLMVQTDGIVKYGRLIKDQVTKRELDDFTTTMIDGLVMNCLMRRPW